MKRGFAPVFIIVALALLIGGGVVYMRSRTTSPSTPSPTTALQTEPTTILENSPEQESTTSGKTMSGNFFDLLKTSGAKECEWSVANKEGEHFDPQQSEPGHVWVSGNRARSTFKPKTIASAEGTEANAILKDGKIYSWVSLGAMGTFGIVFDQKDIEEFKQLPAEEQEQAKQYQQDVEFNCKPWKVDESKFELPTGVKFQAS